jgi:PAS domain S-box-containing protein
MCGRISADFWCPLYFILLDAYITYLPLERFYADMSGRHERIRVLHVDDNQNYGDLVTTFLEREHDCFDVTTAVDPGEGLCRLREGDFDCVVSDYDMPGENGVEFLQTVREAGYATPFILYTGKGSEQVASEAISAGVTDYIQKGAGVSHYTILANRISNAVEQHRAKRQTNLSYRAMDTANEGLSLVTSDGTFSYVNPAFAQLFEYECDELIGEHWTVLYHDEEAERLEHDILPAVVEQGYWSGETVRLTKHGDRLVTDHRLTHTSEGVVICTAQDVTPERTAPTQQTTGFDLLVDAMEDHAFYTLDHEGYITRWNRGAERLTGYTATEIIGEHMERLFIEEDRERGLPEQLIETAKTEGTATNVGRRVRKDGGEFKTSDTLSASYDTSGTIRGFGKIDREIAGDEMTV